MGVTGLWNLIEDAGTRVDVDTLNQKILAVDLSIWIHQSIKGFRDKDNRVVENAHLLGLFYRLCKLLFYQIKPIAIFDGECPALKIHTIQKRLEKRQKTLQKSKNLSLNVLENYISMQLSKEKNSSISDLRNKLKFAQQTFASELYLPANNPKQVDVYKNFVEMKNETKNDIIDDEDSSDTESNNQSILVEKTYHHPQLQNIHDIDINSKNFKNLPAITRYEILIELRESYKQRKSVHTDLLPQEANSFSKFQMAKLLKKRHLQEEIEKLINELNGTIEEESIKFLQSSSRIKTDLLLPNSSNVNAGTLASDEKTRFLLLKTLNQAIDEFPTDDNEQEIDNETNDLKQEIDSQVYKVPNDLPGNTQIESDIERINFLSQSSESSEKSFLPRQLSENIDKNYKKYSQKEETNLVLSDDGSSTNSEDFIEIKVDEDKVDDNLDLFEDFLPFEVSPQTNIKKTDSNETILLENQKEIRMEIKNKVSDQDGVQNIFHVEVADNNCEKASLSNPNPNEESIQVNPSITESQNPEPIDVEELIKQSKESAKLNRQAASVTDQIISDCQELLRLFGIPWLVAPGEAEAQCACLEKLGLCEGIITDDSDVFLFGGQTIYRNFFNNAKYILRYKIDDLKKYYGLDRAKFICLGMLCGTDYTLGIDGVGPVTGMEILTQFPGDGLESLEKFAKWHHHKMFISKDDRPENSVRTKFLRLSLPSSFPSRVIYDAYYNANVDNSTEPFSWSMPQLSELRQYASERFGWSEEKTDSFLLPVLKNLNAKQTQKRIDFYFTSKKGPRADNFISERLKIKRSKRLNEAIRKSILSTMEQNKKLSTTASKESRKNRKVNFRKNKLKTTPTSIKKAVDDVVLSESSSD